MSKGAWASLSVNEGVKGVSFGGEEGANLVVGVVTHSDVLGGVQQVKAEKFEREPIILDIVRTPPLRVRVVHCDSRMQKILYFSHL